MKPTEFKCDQCEKSFTEDQMTATGGDEIYCQKCWPEKVAEAEATTKAIWCKCDLAKMGITPMRVHFEDGPCGSTTWSGSPGGSTTCKVTKHHDHCSKCGGVTQIG